MKNVNLEPKVCTRCVMDTTDPDIIFDENGICNRCKKAEELLNIAPYSLTEEEKRKELERLVKKIKEVGKERDYDCIIGVSGGTDSTYVAYIVVKLGLRPLAIHLDNGWNSELAVKNIENTVKNLDIDLLTYTIDWEEFKDLQMAFLKASTPDSEIPTDHAIVASMFRAARKERVNYILTGTNLSTESIFPPAWSYGSYDWKYINSIQKKFGTIKLDSYPHISLINLFLDIKIRKINRISILNYIDYVKKEAIHTIEKELGWRNYGGKHYESVYTRFFQGYILPKKFGFDKRKSHLSSLIVSGQITREQALNELKKNPYPNKKLLEKDMNCVLNEFEINEVEFERIMNLPPKKFVEYPSYENSNIWKIVRNIYTYIDKNKII